MALVNIPRVKTDPGYRYTMPRLVCKTEGRGNGIKTNIVNMGDIARALKRPPMYPTKFFGCELGAMSKFVDSEEKALVNGAHSEQDLDQILDKFIDMYVLCPKCELPETDINVKKNLLHFKCNACGETGALNNEHKAAVYMIKNPPNNSASSTMGKTKKNKDERRAEKVARQRLKEESSKYIENNSTGVSAEDSIKLSNKKKVGSKSNSSNKKREDGNACTDSAATTPMKGSPDDNEDYGDGVSDNDYIAIGSKELDDLVIRVSSNLKKFETVNGHDDETMSITQECLSSLAQDIKCLQMSQGFDNYCLVYISLCVFFPIGKFFISDKNEGMKFFVSRFESICPLLLDYVTTRKLKCFHILSAVEQFVYNHSDETIKQNFPYIIEKLYRQDVVEGDEIKEYYERSSLSYMNSPSNLGHSLVKIPISALQAAETAHKNLTPRVQPFIDWLKQSDDSSQDEG